MKIKSIETIQLKEFPLIIWVQINTDNGFTGLGETFFAPNAVSEIIHNILSPLLINNNPLDIENHWRNMFEMTKTGKSRLGNSPPEKNQSDYFWEYFSRISQSSFTLHATTF